MSAICGLRSFLCGSLSFLFLILSAFGGEIPDALPELPQPATSFGATLCDGWVYVYGGNAGKAHEFNRECVKGDFLRLKIPDGVAWERLPGGIPLLSSSLVTYAGKVIRIGGMNARNAKGERNDLNSATEVASYDPATGHWTPLPSLPGGRSSHDAAILGGVVYVGGGWRLTSDDGDGAKATWYATALTLDLRAPEKGWQSLPQPFQRRALATVARGTRIWFLGGMDPENKPSRAVDWFEPGKGQWGKGPDLPDGSMAGFGVAACVAHDRLLASPLSGTISALNSDGTRWDEVGQLNPPRFFHRLLPLADGRLIAVGGSNHQGHVRAVELVSQNAKPSAAN